MKNGDLPSVLDPVALLSERPADRLVRGQVGTVIELLDAETAMVEFAGDDGAAFAILPCALNDLIVLHDKPQAA